MPPYHICGTQLALGGKLDHVLAVLRNAIRSFGMNHFVAAVYHLFMNVRLCGVLAQLQKA